MYHGGPALARCTLRRNSSASGPLPVGSTGVICSYIENLFIYLLTQRYIQMYCHVQREQDNKAQITGTNSCPLSLNHTATDTNTMQCN